MDEEKTMRMKSAGETGGGAAGQREPESNLTFSMERNGIAEIVFDAAGRPNVLSSAVMAELDKILIGAAARRGIRALVFRSGQRGIFLAGADLREVAALDGEGEALEKSRLGQAVLDKIERLRYPTFAVIDGACLGGGLELALACDFRIVSDNKQTSLGLPETTLGLLPGFGGTWRLPRLIGLAKALDLILTGKKVDGVKAVKLKLADACYPDAFLKERAMEFVERMIADDRARSVLLKKRKKRRFGERLLQGNPIGRALLASGARKKILAKTRGFFPAPLRALETTVREYGRSAAWALRAERAAFAKLAGSEVSKKLIGLFFMSEDLRKAYEAPVPIRKAVEDAPVRRAAVLGAGKMGGGIAWAFSDAGLPVRMRDVNWDAVAAGYRAVHEVYAETRQRGRLDEREMGLKLHRVTGGIDYAGFRQADVVIEAIIEDKEAKLKALADLEKEVPDDAIIATNTSSLSVTELASALKKPERFIGFHFFNPVPRMPLIEVVEGPDTSDETVFKMIALARRLKKTPILVKDCPGFLVNRVLMAYLSEAILILEEGEPFPLIDRALYDFGLPMGPFTLLDEIGLRVAAHVAQNLAGAYAERQPFGKFFAKIGAAPDLTGRAGGKGFFLYDRGRRTGPNPAISGLLAESHVRVRPVLSHAEITERCLLRMTAEAALCLEERIVEKPLFLDMALILGTGWPAFRGGLLATVDETGLDRVVGRLEELESRFGPRFRAPALLKDMRKHNRRFYP